MSEISRSSVAVLGAGCSGSSLAYMLVRGGFEGDVHLFDRREDFSREQRWCSWGPIPKPFGGLVDASWTRWRVASGGREVVRSSPGRPYLHVHAPRFYERVHGELADHPNVHLHLGSDVLSVKDGSRGVRISTGDGDLESSFAFDSRPLAKPDRGVSLRQSFAGRVVECDGEFFDTRTVTLMEFTDGAGVSFVYVLPFAPDRALVESTTFAEKSTSKAEHLDRVDEYLGSRGVRDYDTKTEESGELSMSNARRAPKTGERTISIGTAGGAMRPSSGYAFVSLLRQSEGLSQAVIRGVDPSSVPAPIPTKYRVFDEIFLEAARRSPSLARESFLRMFERVPPESLVRFLSNESNARDEASLVTALPKTPFLMAALRRATLAFPGGADG